MNALNRWLTLQARVLNWVGFTLLRPPEETPSRCATKLSYASRMVDARTRTRSRRSQWSSHRGSPELGISTPQEGFSNEALGLLSKSRNGTSKGTASSADTEEPQFTLESGPKDECWYRIPDSR